MFAKALRATSGRLSCTDAAGCRGPSRAPHSKEVTSASDAQGISGAGTTFLLRAEMLGARLEHRQARWVRPEH